MELWLNPACSTVRRYLDDPPDEATLRDVVARLGFAVGRSRHH